MKEKLKPAAEILAVAAVVTMTSLLGGLLAQLFIWACK